MEQSGNYSTPVISINIALSGFCSAVAIEQSKIREKIKRIIHTTLKHLSSLSKGDYGFDEENIILRFISSLEFIDARFIDLIKELCPKAEFHLISSIDTVVESKEKTTILNNDIVEESSLILSWICDQIDFAIVISTDLINDRFIHHCALNQLPCAVIQVHTDSHILWTEKSLYDCFDNDKLIQYINRLLPDRKPLSPMSSQSKIIGQKLLWGGLYRRYLKKYKANGNAKPFTKDTLMEQSLELNLSEASKSVHRSLLDWFYYYNSYALEYADKYRSSIYLRAVIPLVITAALAVGFYIENLLGPWSVTFPGTRLKVWSAIAGFGFFSHALLNLYVFRLSENNTVRGWHKGFIDCRFLSEALRIAIHFITYGIPMNYSENFSRYGSKIKKDSSILRQLRSLIRGIPLPVIDYNSEIPEQCLTSLEELVNDQIEYHTSSANRYVNILKSLKLFGKISFYIGFIFVIFRGLLQCFFAFTKIPEEMLGIQVIIKSMANMLALLFPAWAGYFSSKLSLCNFEGLYNNDLSMLEGLKELKQTINDKKNNATIKYQDIYELSKKFSSLMLYEVSEWYGQINNRSIVRL